MRGSPPSGTPRPAPSTAVGQSVSLAFSLLFHAAVVGVVVTYGTAPDLGIELELPSEVEFGLTEGATVETGGPAGEERPAEAPPEPATDLAAEGPGGRDAGPPGPDAGVPVDAGHPRDLVASAEEAEGGQDEGGEGFAGTGGGTTELPPGAQLAVRIDMARIRRSPLAPEVRRLLASIPDWQLVLEGSGIEPVDDLDRLMIASPNLQRSRMLFAGRHEGGPDQVRAAVQAMAEARGVQAPWGPRHGVPVAPWANADDTERVIALVGPQHFTITRPEDLPRLLAVARARAERDEETGEPEGEGRDTHGADALLSMPDGAALTFEVEGARQFMRGSRGVPSRARVVLTERERAGAAVLLEGTFDSEEEARDAQAFWDRQRAAYAGDLFVMAVGMTSALTEMQMDVDGRVLRVRTTLSRTQLQRGLAFLEGQLRAVARDRARQQPRVVEPAPAPTPAP